MDKNKDKSLYGNKHHLRGTNLGLLVVVCIALCTFIGYQCDNYFNISPYGKVIGVLFGVISGMVNMWEQLHKLNKKLEKDKG